MDAKANETPWERKIDVNCLIHGYYRSCGSRRFIPCSVVEIVTMFYPSMRGHTFRWRLPKMTASSGTLDSDAIDIGLPNKYFLRCQVVKNAQPSSASPQLSSRFSVGPQIPSQRPQNSYYMGPTTMKPFRAPVQVDMELVEQEHDYPLSPDPPTPKTPTSPPTPKSPGMGMSPQNCESPCSADATVTLRSDVCG